MKKWEAKCTQAIPKAINQERFNQRIAEVAEVLYDLFCQLERSQKSESIVPGISPGDLNLPLRRTGTHG